MTGKEFKEEKAKIQELRSFSHFDQARTFTIRLIETLFQEHKFSRIVELFYSDVCTPPETFYIFEVAYSLSELGYIDESEKVYEHLLAHESNNSVLLNNLSHIKRQKNQLGEAFELIRKAHEIFPQDEIIAENYHQLFTIVQQQQSIREAYTRALDFLPDESNVVIEKLHSFVENLYKQSEFINYRMPIPEWKFHELIEIDSSQVKTLLEDWLKKWYLRDTGNRSKHLVPIYELNPFLGKELEQIELKQLPVKWLEGFDELTIENLEGLSYFSLLRKIRKMKKKYRDIAERDLNELFLNYLMKNEKAVIVLSGSLLEIILVYYCEKKKITKLYFPRKNNRTEKRDLYECDLAEILQYLKEKKMLSDLFVHVGNISRIYRNFIHPGRELREAELLSQSNSALCFLSTLEIIKSLL